MTTEREDPIDEALRQQLLSSPVVIDGGIIIHDDGYEQQGVYVDTPEGYFVPISELIARAVGRPTDEFGWSAYLGKLRLLLIFEELPE